jgi:hypothetical protein
MIITVKRVDFLGQPVGKVKKTDEGYLTGDAPIAKVGVMTYFLSDGSIRKELVNQDTLFNIDSMNTLKMKPITDTHPPERMLDSKTVKRRKVGFTGENIKRDGEYLVTPLTITDEDAVINIDEGRIELSPGYICDLKLEKGTFQGEHYDAVQLNRRYNHVALCDKARGGSDLKLQLDSVEHCDGFEIENFDAVLTTKARKALPDSSFCYVRGTGDNKVRKFPAHDAAHVRNALARLPQSNIPEADKKSILTCLRRKAKRFGIKVSEDSILNINEDDYNLSEMELTLIEKRRKTMDGLIVFNIDGINYEAAPEVVNFLKKETVRADSAEGQVTELTTKLEAETKRADTAEGERDGFKTKVEELEKIDHTEAINNGITERLDVLEVARAVLDEDEYSKLDEKSNEDIKKLVILKKSPDAKLDDQSEDYVNARYDAIAEGIDFDP